MNSKEQFLNGQILLIDKPYKWSSFQALNKVKWALRKKYNLNKKFKIGHAGTLDPLATGLLLICTGKFTKKIAELQGQTKEYTGTIYLGATTPSYDLETEIDKTYATEHITKSGAYLAALRRTKIGSYNVNDSITPDIFKDKISDLP